MPNHFHGIIKPVGVPLVGTQNVEQPQTMAQQTIGQSQQIGQPQGIAPTVALTDHKNETDSKPGKTLGDMVGAFESITTVNYIRNVKNLHWPPFDGKLWQWNYWDRIIGTHGRVSLLYLSTISKFGTILFLFC
jgi:putative transposase